MPLDTNDTPQEREEEQGFSEELKKLIVPNYTPALNKEATFTVGEEFMYGYDKTPSFINNASLYLESHIPAYGELFSDRSVDELYGEGYSDLSQDKKRQVLLTYRQQQIERDYPELVKREGDSFLTNMGALGGLLVDPTTLLPMTGGIKVASLIGGGVAALYTASSGLAEEGRADLKDVAIAGAVGTVATAGFIKGLKVVSNKLKIRKQAANTAGERKVANDEVDQINFVLAKAVRDGVPEAQHSKIIEDTLGYDKDRVLNILGSADRQVKAPSSQQAAKVQIDIVEKGLSEAARPTNPLWDNLLGVLSTRIAKISKPVMARVRKFELGLHVSRHNSMISFKPLMKAVSKVPRGQQNLLSAHLMNGEFKAATEIMVKYSPDAADSVQKATKEFADNLETLQGLGYGKVGLDNYFPRQVKDFEGLRDSLGKEAESLYEKALKKKARELFPKSKSPVEEMTQRQKEKVLNMLARGYEPKTTGAKLTWNKDRIIQTVSEDQAQFYLNPSETLISYASSTANDINKRLFLGKANITKVLGSEDIDLNQSIGTIVQKEVDKGAISYKQVDQLNDLLKKRFVQGEEAPHVALRRIRDVGYGTVLANPISALTQIGDIGLSMYTQGMANTVRALFGKNKISMVDLGLDDVMASEFATGLDASVSLHKLLTYSGFRRVDRFGKDVLIGAALRNGTKMAKTTKGQAQLAKKYREAWGESDFKELLNELKSGHISDRTKTFLWSELSDVQPISLSEMPAAYLNNPNWRIAYTLKSYSIKQLDVIRRTIVDEFKAGGNKVEGTKQLARYLAIVPLMGGTIEETKDLVLGRGFNAEEIMTIGAPETLLKLFQMSKFSRSQLGSGDASGFVSGVLLPPLGYVDSVIKDMSDLIESGDVLPERTIKELPVGGKLWYNYYGGGLEKWEDWNNK